METIGLRARPVATVEPETWSSPLHNLLVEDFPPDIEGLAEFRSFRETVGQCTSIPLSGQLERLRCFYEPLLERRYDNGEARLRDLEHLQALAARYASRREFLADLALDPPPSTSDLAGSPLLDDDHLILSTIHSAKGCEWDAVHIIHAADGMIPLGHGHSRH